LVTTAGYAASFDALEEPAAIAFRRAERSPSRRFSTAIDANERRRLRIINDVVSTH
jgi:hypothetical protein